jgi:Na+-driven multidrug efflux pump
MGVRGAAVATVVAQLISGIMSFIYVVEKFPILHITKETRGLDFKFIKNLLANGLPMAMQFSVTAIGSVMLQSCVNGLGSNAIAAITIGGKTQLMIVLPSETIGATMATYCGQNYGAKKPDRIMKSFLYCTAIAVMVGVVFGGLVCLFADPLLGIFLKTNPDAVIYGKQRIMMTCLPYFLCGIMEVSTGALRAMGGSLTAMVVSIFGVCVFRVGWIFTIFQIPKFHSMESLFISYPISWVLTFAALAICLFKRYRKEKSKHLEKQESAVSAS